MSPAKENTDIFNKWAPSYYDTFKAEDDDDDDDGNDTLQRICNFFFVYLQSTHTRLQSIK